jgi:hypothetical protein
MQQRFKQHFFWLVGIVTCYFQYGCALFQIQIEWDKCLFWSCIIVNNCRNSAQSADPRGFARSILHLMYTSFNIRVKKWTGHKDASFDVHWSVRTSVRIHPGFFVCLAILLKIPSPLFRKYTEIHEYISRFVSLRYIIYPMECVCLPYIRQFPRS